MRVLHRAGLSLLIASTAILPLTTNPYEIHAATAVKAAATSTTVTTLKAFNLGGSSSARVSNVQFMYGSNEKTVYFTVSVYNGGTKDLDFSDYWLELWTKSGSKYTITMNETDAKKTKVVAKTTQEYRFTATVNANVTVTDLKFKLVKWDFSQPNYTRSLGEVAIPTNYNLTVPTATGRVLRLDGKQISTILPRAQFVVIGGQLESSLTYRITNYSNQSIDLSTLNYYIKRSGGTMNKLSVDSGSETTLLPGTSKELQLYGTLPISKIDPNMQLIVTSTDATTKTEIPFATYAMKPVDQNSIYVKAGAIGKLTIDGMAVNTKIRDTYYDQDGDTQLVSMYLNYTNTGKSSVTLPTYSYYVMTSTGALYPAKTSSSSTAVELSTGIAKEQYLQFDLPSTASTSTLKLVIRKTSEENKKGFVTGLFMIPAKSANQNSSNTAINYYTKQGMFEFSLTRGERLPWGEQDLINAVVTVRNTQLGMKSLPNLKATLLLNGYQVADANVKLIKTDSSVALNGGDYTNYIISTKVPYTYTSNDMTVVLSEVDSDGGTGSTPIGRFQLSSSMMEPPTLKTTETMDIKEIGRKSSLKINQVHTYTDEDEDTKVLYAEFDYSNLETRLANLPNLQAYFKTKDGGYIQGTFLNIDDKVSPSKKGLVAVSAQFPIDYDLTDVELWIGQGITEAAFTPAKGTADAFVNAYKFTLPFEDTTVQQEAFEDLEINPYTLSMEKFSPSLEDAYKIRIDFEYDLEKSTTYEKVAGTHQLVIELQDGDNKYEQVLNIDGSNSELKLGEDIDSSVAFEDSKLSGIIFRAFTINVYDSFNGHKKLLATKKLNTAMTNG
ncbi:hypothetical protein FHS18_002582 [Paenibacillus phyllosphaerae]|uniref:Uncharacterized protein n=1 Tax=Paenibacillus phyllosphaerae TaxID=274593 RepID=A0A7W5FMR3_9BACL|nr:hypothetical protein [Paenibacillus phyllosphaerae]MBB3110515.1 hypothetical protein [Paenibacillus phyllosphaerae]